jgi:hypothetical protein
LILTASIMRDLMTPFSIIRNTFQNNLMAFEFDFRENAIAGWDYVSYSTVGNDQGEGT